MPTYSIICPVFNGGITIQQFIDSCLSQTYKDFEIIIQDGGSSDNTVELIKLYDDARIKLYEEKDSSIYDAMNRGIKKASGEWLYFIGADDKFINSETLEDVYNKIKSTDKKFAYGYVIDDAGQRGGLYNWEMLSLMQIPHQGCFAHNSLGDYLIYTTTYTICGDYIWELKIAKHLKFDFKYLDMPICQFSEGGISSINFDPEFEAIRYKSLQDNLSDKLNTSQIKLSICRVALAYLKKGKLSIFLTLIKSLNHPVRSLFSCFAYYLKGKPAYHV